MKPPVCRQCGMAQRQEDWDPVRKGMCLECYAEWLERYWLQWEVIR